MQRVFSPLLQAIAQVRCCIWQLKATVPPCCGSSRGALPGDGDVPVGITRCQAAPGGATPAGPLPKAAAAAQGGGQNRVVTCSGRQKKLHLFKIEKK